MLRNVILLLTIIFCAQAFANGELIHSGAGPFGGAYGNDSGPFLIQIGFSNIKPNTLNYKTTSITRDLVIRFNEKAVRPLLETPEDYTVVYVNNVIAGSTDPFLGETISELTETC